MSQQNRNLLPQRQVTLFFPVVLMLLTTFAHAQSGRDFWLSPSGNDSWPGTPDKPFRTLKRAESLVKAGDTVHLNPGEYKECLKTRTHGSAQQPITYEGDYEAILRANCSGRLLQINHNHRHFIGFTIDGKFGALDQSSSYADILVYSEGSSSSYRQGVKLEDMQIINARGECVRYKYTQHSEVSYSDISHCGLDAFHFKPGGTNGEGIYIGTADDQWKNNRPDVSSNNLIQHNTINTDGNECVEVKEGGEFNIVEYNTCTGQLDKNAAGIAFRGNWNTARFNEMYGNVGAGVRIGGDDKGGVRYGVNNSVYDNHLHHNTYAGLKIQEAPQQAICGNDVHDNPGGVIRGDAASQFSPTAPCGDTVTKLEIATVSASSEDGNVPANTLDGDLSTRWAAQGDGQWIRYQLAGVRTLDSIRIAFHKGTLRTQTFSVEVSLDGQNWTVLLDHALSSGTTDALQNFDVLDAEVLYVRIVGYGNSSGNGWNSLTEVEILGF